MTTLRFKWSIQYNHKIFSPSGCVVWVIFQSSSERSSSPIARSASTVALRLGLGDSVPSDFSYTPCSVMSMSKGGLVPQLGWSWCVWQRATGPTPPSRSPKRRLFASTNLAVKFPGMPGAPYTGQIRLRARDRLRRLRASGGALFAFSAKTRSVGTIAFVGKANAKKADESGFPDEGKNFPDRPI